MLQTKSIYFAYLPPPAIILKIATTTASTKIITILYICAPALKIKVYIIDLY